MPRRKPDNLVKERMWTALLKAAKSYHRHDADRGMVTKIAADAGVSKASVSEWKNKGNYPEEATLRRLASLYNVSAESLSGYNDRDVMAEHYGPPDEMLERSVTITRQVLKTLLPDATLDQFVAVTRRANELIVEGRSDAEVRGYLFNELTEGESEDRE
jgi:transcriptional regulator with XRE-family HTH domain